MKAVLSIVSYLSWLLVATPAFADGPSMREPTCESGASVIRMDQDLMEELLPSPDAAWLPELFVDNEDRDYTMGVELSRYVCLQDAYAFPSFGVQKLLPRVLWPERSLEKGYRTSFGVAAYTPDNLNTTDVVPDDRPYASLLYMTNTSVISLDSPNAAIESTFGLGLLGTGLADKVQTWIHRKNREYSGLDTPYDPLGWHNQIADGIRLTGLASLAYYQRLTKRSEHYDLVASGEASLGYFTGASLGLMARVGWFNADTPVQNVVRAGGIRYPGVAATGTERSMGFYGFAGFRTRLVVWNELLQGGGPNTAHRLTSAQTRHIVSDYVIGMAVIGFTKGNALIYCSTRGRDHYLRTQRRHSWCGFSLGWGF